MIILFVLYTLIFLFLKGTIGGNRVEGPNSLVANEVLHRQRINVAKRMLWYPLGEPVDAFYHSRINVYARQLI